MKNNISSEKVSINGPVNYVKIQGDNNKILHIFFDLHYEINNETECDEYDSININKYIKKFLTNTKKNINYFLEIIPEKEKYISDKNDIYIRKTMDEFYNIKNKLKDNQNIKLHYINIRYFFYFNEITNNIEYFFNNFHDNYFEKNKKEKIYLLKQNTQLITQISEYLYKILEIYEIILKKDLKYEKVDLTEYVNYKYNDKNDYISYINNSIINIMTKILKRYDDKQTKQIMNQLFKKYFIDGITDILKKISEVINTINVYLTLEENSENNHGKICNIFNKINYYTFNGTLCQDDFIDFKCDIEKKIIKIKLSLEIVFAQLQDIYFIRKFIDKSYIEESIIYSGFTHSIFYIYILIKYFNFSITDCYYVNKNLLKNDSMLEINNSVIKSTDYIHLNPYFYKIDGKQCVKINPL